MGQETGSAKELGGLIRDVQAGFSSFHALALTHQDVSIAQFAVLLALAQERPRKMSDVAAALHVSLPAVTHLVDRLEEKRMVERQSHPSDRRVNLIDLTPKGMRVAEQTQGRVFSMLTAAITKHSAAERKVILTFMEQLRDGIRGLVNDVERKV